MTNILTNLNLFARGFIYTMKYLTIGDILKYKRYDGEIDTYYVIGVSDNRYDLSKTLNGENDGWLAHTDTEKSNITCIRQNQNHLPEDLFNV